MALEPLPEDAESGESLDGAIRIVEPLCAVFRRTLKAEGLKYTPERAQILDAIIRFEGLFQAEELLAAVRAKGFRVSKATIYRTIKLLQDSGIIQRVLFDEEQAHYQLAYGPRPHDLLIRLDSHEAVEIDIPELIALRDRICRERGLEPRGHRLHIFAVGGEKGKNGRAGERKSGRTREG